MVKMNRTFHIRKAKLTDALDIASIQIDTWRTTYVWEIDTEYLHALDVYEKEIRWKDKIITDDTLIFIACIWEKAIGFISGWKSKEENYDGAIFAFYIRDEFQWKWIWKALFLEMIDALKNQEYTSFYLWVILWNPAIGFYQKMWGKSGIMKQEIIGKQEIIELQYTWKI